MHEVWLTSSDCAGCTFQQYQNDNSIVYVWDTLLTLKSSHFISNNCTSPDRAILVVASDTHVQFSRSSFTPLQGYEILLEEQTTLLYSDKRSELLDLNPAGLGSVRSLDDLPRTEQYLDESDAMLLSIQQVCFFCEV